MEKGRMKNLKALFVVAILLVALVTFGCRQSASIQEEKVSMPTATTQPTCTPIPGWTKFEGESIELWLPESYLGGNISEDIDVIVANLRKQGPDFEQMAQLIEQNPEMYVIWATDSKVGSSGFLTNVAVTTEKVLSVVTLDTYLDIAAKQFPSQFQIVERDLIPLGEYESGRLVVEFELSGIYGKQILYVIKDGTTMWVLTYATGMEEYEERLSEFEQSASTFRTKSE
jgi:hypothetical protein